MDEIYLLEDDELSQKYQSDINIVAISLIKGIKRYGVQKLPREIWLKILYYSLRGMACQEEHWDISQRISLYEYIKEKGGSDDPYIKQFMKETEEKYKHALL